MKPLSITPDTTDICIPTEGFEGQTGLTVRLERVGRRGTFIVYPAIADESGVCFTVDDHTLKVKPGRYLARVLGGRCELCVPIDIENVCQA
jgi:hypothetical protein